MADQAKKDFHVWRATKDSECGIMVTPDAVALVGSRQNAVVVDSMGVHIGGGGNISFNTTSESIRQDGLLVQRGGFSQMIPTTIMTPASQLLPWPPLAMVTSMISVLPIFLAALG